jgi:hypothetical protein
VKYLFYIFLFLSSGNVMAEGIDATDDIAALGQLFIAGGFFGWFGYVYSRFI